MAERITTEQAELALTTLVNEMPARLWSAEAEGDVDAAFTTLHSFIAQFPRIYPAPEGE